MAIEEAGTTGLPDEAPIERTIWDYGSGERTEKEWPLGTPTDIDAKYESFRSAVVGGSTHPDNRVARLIKEKRNGQARLIASFERFLLSEEQTPGFGQGVRVTEELYGVDQVKPVYNAPYFEILTEDEIAWIKECSAHNWSEAQITAQAKDQGHPTGHQWANWDIVMKNLRYHLQHGHESFVEASFVYRRTKSGIRTSQLNESFANVNTVGGFPGFETPMGNLVDAMPAGQWLKKSPTVEYNGQGIWSTSEEYWWAIEWSKVYTGGTWGL